MPGVLEGWYKLRKEECGAGSQSTRCITVLYMRGRWLHADGDYPGEGDMFRGGDHEDGEKTTAKDIDIRRIASNGLRSWHSPKLLYWAPGSCVRDPVVLNVIPSPSK